MIQKKKIMWKKASRIQDLKVMMITRVVKIEVNKKIKKVPSLIKKKINNKNLYI